MNAPRRRTKQRRPTKKIQKTAPPAEFWKATPDPPKPAPIHRSQHPTALIQSMGPPPLPSHEELGQKYVEAVVERAAMLATALAASADLLSEDDDL